MLSVEDLRFPALCHVPIRDLKKRQLDNVCRGMSQPSSMQRRYAQFCSSLLSAIKSSSDWTTSINPKYALGKDSWRYENNVRMINSWSLASFKFDSPFVSLLSLLVPFIRCQQPNWVTIFRVTWRCFFDEWIQSSTSSSSSFSSVSNDRSGAPCPSMTFDFSLGAMRFQEANNGQRNGRARRWRGPFRFRRRGISHPTSVGPFSNRVHGAEQNPSWRVQHYSAISVHSVCMRKIHQKYLLLEKNQA